MTIQNDEAFLAGLWDWAIVGRCFGGKIVPTDIDGIVERNGHFLVIEAKSKDARVPNGQAIMFSRLTALKEFTVVIVWGDKNNPVKMQVWGEEQKVATLEDFQKFCQNWYLNACSKPIASQRILHTDNNSVWLGAK